MPKDYPRSRRVAEQVRRSLSQILLTQINDPRLSRITISEVEVSKDLAHAKVFVVPFCGTSNSSENVDEIISALTKAAGFIRSELGRQLKTRLTPQLHFIYDQSFEKADSLTRLINQALGGESSIDE